MDDAKDTIENEIGESAFAKAANRWSWLPGLGLVFFFVFTPLTLLQLGKGRIGFKLVSRAFIKVMFLSILPLVTFICWPELPENYYPDVIFNKHGQYQVKIQTVLTSQSDNPFEFLTPPTYIEKSETHYYFFGELFKKITYYDNLKIQAIEHLKNDKRHGQFTLFHENGKKKLQIQYNMDSFDGLQVAWYENGQKKFEGKYKKDRHYGIWQGWYQNNQQSWIAQYNEEGKQTDQYNVYHEDGKVALEGHYNDGEEVGKWTCYKEDGSINWQTDDYSKNRHKRPSDSKYKYGIIAYNNVYDEFDEASSNKSDTKENKNIYYVNLSDYDSDEKISKVVDELRRKHITDIYIDNIGDDVDCVFLHFKGLPLRTLNLKETNITDASIVHLKAFQLESINLSRCKNITDSGLKQISKMPIKILNLSDTNVTDDGLANIKGMKLKQINLARVKITNAGLANLAGMPLERINLNWCRFISDNGLSYLKSMPLTKLNLSMCQNVNGSGFVHLKGLPLKELSLFGCERITDNAILNLNVLPLKKLDLSGMAQAPMRITEKGFSYLKGMALEELKLDYSGVNNQSLEYLKDMPLRSLSLDNCSLISDSGLSNLKAMPLEVLSLTNCQGISKVYRKKHPDPTEIKRMLEEVSKSVNDTHKQEENKSN